MKSDHVGGDPTTTAVRVWKEENGIIRLSITFDGEKGGVWPSRIEKGGYSLGNNARKALLLSGFVPTKEGTLEVAIIKGSSFERKDLVVDKIEDRAENLGFWNPNMDLACFLREKLTDEDIVAMGLDWIVVIHTPVIVGRNPIVLGVGCGQGGRRLGTFDVDGGFEPKDGFAYIVGLAA